MQARLLEFIKTDRALSRGAMIAAAMAGSWRATPPPLTLSVDELASIKDLIYDTGAAGMVWWRLRNSSLKDTDLARQFLQAFRFHSVESINREITLKQTLAALQGVNIEPLFAKGWTIACRYPEVGLRPYVDIDLCVRAEQFPMAAVTLKKDLLPTQYVDLHSRFTDLNDRSVPELFEHSQELALDGMKFRVIGNEDHLRYLCLHFLRHGAWRPLWLCDIAMLLESITDEFDWDYFYRGDQQNNDWIGCTLGLACQLLDARVENELARRACAPLPDWFAAAALRQWGRFYRPRDPKMIYYLHHPFELYEGIKRRWPNPIEATIALRGPFNETPRAIFQMQEFCRRLSEFLARGSELADS
jgi:hypothetical protein